MTTFSVISLWSKFGIESLSRFCLDAFQKGKVNSSQNTIFLTIKDVNKDRKSKAKFFVDNHVQNILKLFDG